MKSLTDCLNESLSRVKTTKLSGSKHFGAASNEYNVEIDITSSNWHKTSILNNKVTAFWTPDSEWIVYYYDKTPDAWAAVAHGTLKPKDYDENMFKDFDALCASGATVPEFDEVDADDLQ